jgi:hypothetical protein
VRLFFLKQKTARTIKVARTTEPRTAPITNAANVEFWPCCEPSELLGEVSDAPDGQIIAVPDVRPFEDAPEVLEGSGGPVFVFVPVGVEASDVKLVDNLEGVELVSI